MIDSVAKIPFNLD